MVAAAAREAGRFAARRSSLAWRACSGCSMDSSRPGRRAPNRWAAENIPLPSSQSRAIKTAEMAVTLRKEASQRGKRALVRKSRSAGAAALESR